MALISGRRFAPPRSSQLGRNFTAEQVAAHESYQANIRRLHDLGIKQLYNNREVLPQVAAAIDYMDTNYQKMRQRLKVLKRRKNTSEASKDVNSAAKDHFEACTCAVQHLTVKLEKEHRNLAIARFILEELSTTTWQLTNDLIDIHGRSGGGGSGGICTLMGYGDPSGRGEGMSFLREPENKAMHSTVAAGGAAPNAGEKLVGTDKDLRRLSMKELASMLRSYGTPQDKIDTLKRWDRVHLLRDFSTRVTSDGLANDNQIKFARGERLKSSEQRQVYRERIQQIWERQKEALGKEVDLTAELEAIDEQDSESEEDDEENKFQDDLLDLVGGTQDVGLLAGGEAASTGIFGDTGEAKMREINKNKQDAADLQALRNELAEDRQEKKNMAGVTTKQLAKNKKGPKKYVVRRKIITTLPDGTQTTSFQFIVEPENKPTPEYLRLVKERTEKRRELGLKEARRKERKRRNELAAESEAKKAEASAAADGTKAQTVTKIFGHAMFADEDIEYEEAMKISISRQSKIKNNALRFSTGNLKERLNRRPGRKPKNDVDDYENYTATKTTSKDRSKKRQRGDHPNVQLNKKLERVLYQLENRQEAIPFRRGVDNKLYPDYKSKIKKPMDLKKIRDRCKSTMYRRVNDFLADVSLIYENSAAYNGMTNEFTNAARTLYQTSCSFIETEKEAFEILEGMVQRSMASKKGNRLTKEQQDAQDAFERQEQARLQSQEAKKALTQAPQSKIGLLTDLINDDDSDDDDEDDDDDE